MARTLLLSLDGNEFEVELYRVDREDLYGKIEIEAFDSGKPADLKLLAADGRTIIDTGGTALLMIDEDGNSVPRPELKVVDLDGNELKPVPSSFDGVNILKKSSVDEYLSTLTRMVYYLKPVGEAENVYGSLLESDAVYKFPFSYRGGVDEDQAFVLSNSEGVFLTVGKPAALEFLKLNQSRDLDSTEDEEIVADEISFDLM
jgi:hypothetical protein